MSGAPPLLVVSPHLDDAVLSCGGRIARATDGGRRVVIATLFTRDEPQTPPSPFAAELRSLWRLPAGEVMRRRREEDLEACRRLGAEPRHLDLADALYRTSDGGAAIYPDARSLYGEPAEVDFATLHEAVSRLTSLAAELGGTPEILGPLGVGHHVDHLLARRAVERIRPDAALYEEFPYTEWKWFAVRRALGGAVGWIHETQAVDATLLDRRRHAITAYASQVPVMFRTEARLAKQLRRAVRRAGGERIWRKR